MSFQPVVPLDGYAGWRFLKKTLPVQAATHASGVQAQRDAAYFRERIGSIETAEQLVADRQLLRVALTAFGLGDDLPNRAFVRKALESATFDPASFANRLTDKRYLKMARAFGFGDGIFANTRNPGFADQVLGAFRDRSFEEALGTQNESMRVALSLERELGELAAQGSTDETKWFTILGTPSLRVVFEKAFRLPTAFGTLDIDRQVEVLRARTERLTGSDEIAQFTDPARIETLIQRYFLSEQVSAITAQSSQSVALGMLQTLSSSMRNNRR